MKFVWFCVVNILQTPVIEKTEINTHIIIIKIANRHPKRAKWQV